MSKSKAVTPEKGPAKSKKKGPTKPKKTAKPLGKKRKTPTQAELAEVVGDILLERWQQISEIDLKDLGVCDRLIESAVTRLEGTFNPSDRLANTRALILLQQQRQAIAEGRVISLMSSIRPLVKLLDLVMLGAENPEDTGLLGGVEDSEPEELSEEIQDKIAALRSLKTELAKGLEGSSEE